MTAQIALDIGEGFVKVPHSVLLNTTLSVYARMTWITIAYHSRDGSDAWPSEQRLTQMLGISDSTLRRALRELERAGLIATTRRGRGQTNVYRLTDRSTPVTGTGLDQSQGPGEVDAVEVDPKEVETPSAEQVLTDQVLHVWDYWCERRQPKRTDLEPSQEKLIAKAVRAGFEGEELCRAIDALLASDWHRERKKLHLSVIFATRPGGPTLRDQIESWIEQAPSLPSPGEAPHKTVAGVYEGRVASLQMDVLRGWHEHKQYPPPTDSAIERAHQAAEELKDEFGIEVSFGENDRPVFS